MTDIEPADPIDIHVGKRLRIARNMRKLSQGYLASCIGVSYQQIQKYEKGLNCISAGKLAMFAKYLGVPIIFFFQEFPEFSLLHENEKSVQLLRDAKTNLEKAIVELLL